MSIDSQATQLSNERLALAMTSNPEVEASLRRLSVAAAGLDRRVFNADKKDYHIPELFIGTQESGLLDTIHRAFPALFTKYEELKSMDWKHNEYDFSSCVEQFKTCSPSIYRMMIRTLAWQWEGDSTAGRALSDILLPMCTATETRVGYTRIADNENLHALSYSEIVRGSFEDPSVILDEVTAVRESHGRMAVVAGIFSEARRQSLIWQLTGVRTKELENALFMMLAGVYMLERVQFMASFAITFGICSLGLFEPIGSTVQLIARDEWNNHVPFGEEVLKCLLQTEWGMAAFNRCRADLVKAHVEVLTTECDWVEYIHSDGDELVGVPKTKLKQFSLFCGYGSTELFGITADVEAAMNIQLPTTLPLSYMADWIDINEKQSSPQEQDNNQYLFGTVSTNAVSDKKYDFPLQFHHQQQAAATGVCAAE